MSYPNSTEKGIPYGNNMLKLWRALPISTKRREKTVLTPKINRRIKSALSAEKPTVQVGKEGITAQLIAEICKQLDAREIIKIKILKTALHETEAKTLAATIAEQTEAELVDVRGHTFMLYKHKKKQ